MNIRIYLENRATANMTLAFKRKNIALKYIRNFMVAAILSALIAVTIDYVCFLVIGETTAGTWYDKYWIGFFFCCLFITSSFFIFRSYLADRPEYVYLMIVLTITLLMAWSISFFIVGWDTGIHFRNVLGWADIDDQFELSRSELAYVSTNLLNDDGTGFPFTLEGTYQMESWLNDNDQDIQEVRSAYSFWNIATHINYVPSAVVMYFCELFNASFSACYFLSLLPCIIIYAFVTFFGMRKLQSGKMLYAVIALLPTSLFLTANYGYQYWNMAFFLYGFACLASFLQRKQHVPLREVLFMLLAMFLASLPRLSYAPLILLSLLVPESCFKTKKLSVWYRVSIVAITLLAASYFAIPRLLHGFGSGDSRGGSSINPESQLEFILSDPLAFLQRVVVFLAPPFVVSDESTYANDVVSGFLTPSGSIRALGFYGYLGYLSQPLFLFLLAMLTAVTITDKNDEVQYGWLPGTACIAMSLAILVCIIAYMYMDFNNVGEDAFRGVQSRYLLPFMYPCLAFVGSRKWGLNGSLVPKRIYNGIVLGAMTFILLAGWWQVYLYKIY